MKKDKLICKRIKMELQELFGLLSIRELISNQLLAKKYESIHNQMIRV